MQRIMRNVTNGPRVVGLALVLSFLLLVALMGASIGSPPAIAAPAEDSMTHAVAAFANYAVAEADLLNPNGDFLDYRGIEFDGQKWAVQFRVYRCVALPVVETCLPNGDGPAELIIEAVGSTLRVTDASGPFSLEQRTHLMQYRHEAQEVMGARWEYPAVILGGFDGNRIEGSAIWLGPIGVLGSGSTCHAELLDEAGDVIWRSDPVDRPAPFDEGARSGGITAFGRISDRIIGSPRIQCQPWAGSGWTPSTLPVVSFQSGAHAFVVLEVVWNDPPFAAAFTRCDIAVSDSLGTVVGNAAIYLDGPAAEEGPSPVHLSRPLPVEVAGGEAASAAAQCSLIPSGEFE